MALWLMIVFLALSFSAACAGRAPGGPGVIHRVATGENLYPNLELIRLTIPRRVYTQAHMDVTGESVIDLFKNPERVVGLRFTHEPEYLRFFQARFEPVEGELVLRREAGAVATA